MGIEFDDGFVCGTGRESCKWQMLPGKLSCVSSPRGSCNRANILEADESDFHDSDLIKASCEINEILANIPPDPNGRTLSFVHTNMGTLLAWVEHGGTLIEGAVSSDHDDDAVTAALKLKL
jgi:hypothetical protein